MNKRLGIVFISSAVALAGCMTAPKRPDFSAPDQVQQIDPQAIVGTWNVTVLNALEGEQVDSAVYTYNADGSWLSAVSNDASGFAMEAKGVGRWEVRGEEVFVTMDDVEIISDNPMAKLIGGMMKGMIEKTAGSINPYEMTSDRMVWLTDDNQALQFDRK